MTQVKIRLKDGTSTFLEGKQADRFIHLIYEYDMTGFPKFFPLNSYVYWAFDSVDAYTIFEDQKV